MWMLYILRRPGSDVVEMKPAVGSSQWKTIVKYRDRAIERGFEVAIGKTTKTSKEEVEENFRGE